MCGLSRRFLLRRSISNFLRIEGVLFLLFYFSVVFGFCQVRLVDGVHSLLCNLPPVCTYIICWKYTVFSVGIDNWCTICDRFIIFSDSTYFVFDRFSNLVFVICFYRFWEKLGLIIIVNFKY